MALDYHLTQKKKKKNEGTEDEMEMHRNDTHFPLVRFHDKVENPFLNNYKASDKFLSFLCLSLSLLAHRKAGGPLEK